MKKIWSIFRNDLKKIGTNLVAFIVMIGICILPALYAWFNIASNWDPYGNTKNIKIAVVNLDEGSEFGNIKIDIGSQVIENLKTNNQLGWQFVSKAEAEEGVNVGTYYASVTIPKDFSANMTSILSGELKRPEIIYTLNEKLNAIAPKITDKGAEAIKNSVNQSFIDTITTTLAETITTTAGTADSGYVKLKDDLTGNVQEIIDNIDAVETSIDLVVTAIDSSSVLLDNAKDGLPNVQELLVGAGTLSSDTKNTISGASSAASQITAGADGVITAIDSLYSQISPDIDAAFAAINEDSTSAANKFTEITKVNSKVISLESQLVTFFTLIGKRLDVDNSEIITRLNTNITQQNNIINKINEISDSLKKTGKIPENAKSELESLVGTANQGIVGISNEFSQNVKPAVDTLLDDVFTELDGITGAMNDIDGTVPDIETALDSGKESLDALKTSLVAIKKTLDNGKERLNNIVDKIDSIDDEKSLAGFIESLSFAPSDFGEFMSSPVKIQNVKVYPVENYGSAMAPFYSVLAIWVGSIVLVAVLKTEIGPKDEKRLGGWRELEDVSRPPFARIRLRELRHLQRPAGEAHDLEGAARSPARDPERRLDSRVAFEDRGLALEHAVRDAVLAPYDDAVLEVDEQARRAVHRIRELVQRHARRRGHLGRHALGRENGGVPPGGGLLARLVERQLLARRNGLARERKKQDVSEVRAPRAAYVRRGESEQLCVGMLVAGAVPPVEHTGVGTGLHERERTARGRRRVARAGRPDEEVGFVDDCSGSRHRHRDYCGGRGEHRLNMRHFTLPV